MITSRRTLFVAGAGGLAAAVSATGASALLPSSSDQSAALARALEISALSGNPVVLGAGTFVLSRVPMPAGATLVGVPGHSRLVAAQSGPILIVGKGTASTALVGLDFDGKLGSMGEREALVVADGVADLTIRDCGFLDTGGTALFLQACGGRIETCRILGADTAIYTNDSTGLSIEANLIRFCRNNGILVHRTVKGDDGTLVLGNRIERIAAQGGGLGWYGNGVNIYRAGGVITANNIIRDCGFSFIRYNSGDGAQILGNNCRNAAETGIYVEFSFEGAVVSSNQVEGAAAGISVVNFNEGGRLAAITGNVIRRMRRRPDPETKQTSYGQGIAAEADSAVTGNVIEDCEWAGIGLGYGTYLRDVACTGNVIRNSGAGIVATVAEAARNVLISANVISGCAGGDVVGDEWDKRTNSDLAKQPVAGITVAGNISR